MYKDVLQNLNNDRRVDDSFIERLEKNGFEIYRGRYEYWDNQEYIRIGREKIFLVKVEYDNNSSCLRYRFRNDVAKDIKYAIEEQSKLLKKERDLIDTILPQV